MKRINSLFIGLYAVSFFMCFGVSARGSGAGSLLGFLILAAFGSLIQATAQTTRIRWVGFGLVIIALVLLFHDIDSVLRLEAELGKKREKAAFLQGRFSEEPFQQQPTK